MPSPLDGRKRQQIPAPLLALAGGGDPARAPAELVCVLGDTGFRHEQPVTAVLSDPTGKKIITASEMDGVVRVWDSATRVLLHSLQGPRSTYGLALSRDGRLLAATGNREGSRDGQVKVWDLTTGKEQATMLVRFGARGVPGVESSMVWNAAFSPDGQQLATAGNDWVLRVWNAKTGAELRFWQAGNYVNDVAFSPDGKRLAAVTYQCTLHI
jgi:WD40 repeat protein